MRSVIFQAIRQVPRTGPIGFVIAKEEKTLAATRAYAVVKLEDAVALMDTSAKQNGKEGYLLSSDTLYLSDLCENVPLAGLHHGEPLGEKEEVLRLTYADGTVREVCCRYALYISRVLNAIVKLAAEKKIEIPVRESYLPQPQKDRVVRPAVGRRSRKIYLLALKTVAPKRGRYFEEARADSYSLDMALKHMAPGCEAEDAIALLDTSLTKSRKKGYLLSLEALYSHAWEEPVKLAGLRKAEFCPGSSSRVQLSYQDGNIREVHCHYDPGYICGVLNALANFLTRDEELLAAAEEAHRQGQEAEAFNLYQKAAEWGSAEAQIRCGEMCASGRGRPEDKKEAFRWFEKAAEQGDSQGQLCCGQMYDQGEGTKTNKKRAFELILKSAGQDNAQAQYELGAMYRDGRGTAAYPDLAFVWFMKSAKQGYLRAMSELGDIYDQGRAVPVNLEEALIWYKKARDAGDESAQGKIEHIEKRKRKQLCASKAQNAYESGDYGCALECWLLLAEDGDMEAQFKCGEMYDKGLGTEKDSVKAFSWYEKAAKQGCSDAMLQCGIMCREGDGTEQSEERAQYWFDLNMQLLGQHLGGFFGKLEKDPEKD